FFFFSRRRRHTRFSRDWSSDVCSSDLGNELLTVYRKLNIPLTVEEEGVWMIARPTGSALRVEAKNFQAGVVPDLKGMGLADALFLAENAGLKPVVTGNGKVVVQSPKPGEKIKRGSPIVLKMN